MSKTKTNSLPRLTKVLLDIIFGLLILVIAALAIGIIISPILANQSDLSSTASIPVSLGTGDEARMVVNFLADPEIPVNNVYLEEARGILRLETKSPVLLIIANSAKLLIALGLAYVFSLLRKIMQTILDGKPFQAENIARIRQLGYAVLVVGFGSGLFEGLAAWNILRLLPDTIPAFQVTATFDARLILGGSLFIFLLAKVWGYGLELERDQALTV